MEAFWFLHTLFSGPPMSRRASRLVCVRLARALRLVDTPLLPVLKLSMWRLQVTSIALAGRCAANRKARLERLAGDSSWAKTVRHRTFFCLGRSERSSIQRVSSSIFRRAPRAAVPCEIRRTSPGEEPLWSSSRARHQAPFRSDPATPSLIRSRSAHFVAIISSR
jgi:hypothetical protein